MAASNLLLALKNVIQSTATTTSDDYDPARVYGYLIVLLCAVTYLGLSIYDTIVNRHFDYGGFGLGVAGIGAMVMTAAAGVRIKQATEAPAEEIQRLKLNTKPAETGE